MIFVDFSVWIDYFNGRETPQTDWLDSSLGQNLIIMIDVMIATFCIHKVLPLLHDDRDFDPMVKFLGLKEVEA